MCVYIYIKSQSNIIELLNKYPQHETGNQSTRKKFSDWGECVTPHSGPGRVASLFPDEHYNKTWGLIVWLQHTRLVGCNRPLPLVDYTPDATMHRKRTIVTSYVQLTYVASWPTGWRLHNVKVSVHYPCFWPHYDVCICLSRERKGILSPERRI